MAGQRRAARIGDTASSTIESIAVGEVRVSGQVVPAELTLTSPLQSRDCVWYRARVDEDEGRYERTILDEERAVGFRVRDGAASSGSSRAEPSGSSRRRSTSGAGCWASSQSASSSGRAARSSPGSWTARRRSPSS